MSGEAPGGEGKTCPGCGGLGWILAGDEQLGCIDCNGTGHAPSPPSTATAPGAGGREEKPCGCFAPDGDACHRHACHRNARPESTPMQISGMHDSCDWCQREIPDGCYGVLCSECDTKAHDALDTAHPPRPAQDAVRKAAERLARFGAACLSEWWENDCGDLDGATVQEYAEAAGLWHQVERHADGVECEWCNNEEPCGELTDTGLAALCGGQKGEGR